MEIRGIFRGRKCKVAYCRPLGDSMFPTSTEHYCVFEIVYLDRQEGLPIGETILDQTFNNDFELLEEVECSYEKVCGPRAETNKIDKPYRKHANSNLPRQETDESQY